jgi:SsrA-binding protein
VAKDAVRDLVTNRRARFDYALEDTFEAGIALLGSEVKSLRAARGNLQDAFVRLDRRGAWLVGCHISPYPEARDNHEPLRERQLLLHAHELSKLRKATAERGKTLVALRLYLRGPRIKLELAVGKGKKLHDKRESIKERAHRRDMRRD